MATTSASSDLHAPPPDGRAPTAHQSAVLLRVACLALAVAAIAWGVLDGRLRNGEGILIGRSAFAFGLAGAFLVAALGAGTRAAVATRWGALLVLAQASALQLISAGTGVVYQHYRTLGAIVSERWTLLHLMVLVAQLVVCAIGVPKLRNALPNLTGSVWTRARIALVVAVVFVCSATLSRSPVVFGGELVFATLVQLVALVNVALAVAALPADAVAAFTRRIDALLGRPAPDGRAEPGGPDRFAWTAAAWTTGVAVLLVWAVYQRHPHVPDEVVYLKHAQYFAHGLIALPLPPVPPAFDLNLMYFSPTEWFSPVPPGWPAVLAVGEFFHLPWLVDPVLAGINVLLTYMIARELFDRRTARIAVILLCVSPWHVFMAMNFMTHTASLTAALVAALLTTRLRRLGGWWRALVAGGAIGMVSLIRPLEGLAVALVLGFWTLYGPHRKLRIGATALLAVGAIAVGAVTLPYNARLTGNARTFPIMAYIDHYYAPHSNDMGFGANRGLGWSGLDPLPGHGPLDVMINADFNMFSIDIELFGWAVGSILPLALVVFSRRMRRMDKLLLIPIGVVAGLHSFYWFSGGPDFGARYWYLILIPCILLTARAARLLPESLIPASDVPNDENRSAAQTRILLAGALLAAGALLTFFPWRSVDKYYHYRGMRPDVRTLAAQTPFGKSLVLIRGARHPDYASAAIYNPLDLRADAPIYVWDRDAATRAAVLAAYSDRKVWIVDGPTVTGAGFRVVRGPLLATELLQETDRSMTGSHTAPSAASKP